MTIIHTPRLVLMPHTPESIEAWSLDRALLEKQMQLEPYGLLLED